MATTNLIITNAGLAAVAGLSGTDKVTLAEVGFGTGKTTVSASTTDLSAEFKRLPVQTGTIDAGAATAHMTVQDTSAETYDVCEVGVYTSTGVLFAVCSSTTPFISKAQASHVMLAIDLALTNVDPTSIEVGDTNFQFADATEERKGILELATEAEAKAGTDHTRAITPKTLDAVIESHDNVHKSGDETIAGKKTFTESVEVKRVNPYFDIVQTDITKGAPPTSTSYAGVRFGGSEGVSADSKQFCAILHTYDSKGDNALRLQVKNHEASSTEKAELALVYGADGIPYAVAPTPTTTDKSNKIATTEWVRRIALDLAGGKMAGAITFEKNEDQKIQVLDGGDLLIGSTSDSSLLRLRGENSDEHQGSFQLRAGAKDKDPVYLVGKPDGTLTWKGKDVTLAGDCLPLTGGTVTGTIVSKQSTIEDINTVPASNQYHTLAYFKDSKGQNVGGIQVASYADNGKMLSKLMAYRNGKNTHVGVGYDNDGNAYTYAPNPAATSNANEIATTSWVTSKFNALLSALEENV